jgi:hypothetical protein
MTGWPQNTVARIADHKIQNIQVKYEYIRDVMVIKNGELGGTWRWKD